MIAPIVMQPTLKARRLTVLRDGPDCRSVRRPGTISHEMSGRRDRPRRANHDAGRAFMAGESETRDDGWLRGLVAKERGLPIGGVTDDELRKFFENCARTSARLSPEWICERICDEAMSIIGVRLCSPAPAGFDPQRNTSFRAWCVAVPRNAAVDLRRRAPRAPHETRR